MPPQELPVTITTEGSGPPGQELPPAAHKLMHSLRAVGYSTAAALADLVDNSIAARARSVSIMVMPPPARMVAVIDDGQGMHRNELVAAMRFGSSDPRDERHSHDLGRFGLGLKTASLSQCRRVTVVSLRDGQLSIARWDLDACEARGMWWLELPDRDSLPPGPLAILETQGRGTAIIWERLDHLDAGGGDRSVIEAADHLALVFHRFLSGEITGPFVIRINNRELPVMDPFLQGHSRGQALHTETIRIDGGSVGVTPFVLPFPSRLKPNDLERAGGRDSVRTAHGFYIYRGGRLVVPGGWHRIVPADELVRLARIRVDVPVQLDHLWKVDIRKAFAEPPPALRPHLRRIVGDVTQRSRRVYTHKGAPDADPFRTMFWQRIVLRDRGVTWRVNRDHPIVATFLESQSDRNSAVRLLDMLEAGLPLQDIHIHTVNDQPITEPDPPDEAELREIALQLATAFDGDAGSLKRILANLHMMEPFNRNPEAASRIAARMMEEC